MYLSINDQTIKTKLKDSFIYNVSETKLHSAREMTCISLRIRRKSETITKKTILLSFRTPAAFYLLTAHQENNYTQLCHDNLDSTARLPESLPFISICNMKKMCQL